MIAIASQPIHLGARAPAVPSNETPRMAIRSEPAPVGGQVSPWRWKTVITDCLQLLAVVWSLPLAILGIGSAIALTIALLLWLGRAALRMF